jgi:hypothetical protein
MIILLSLIFILGTKCFGFTHNIEALKIPGLGVLNLGHILMIIAYTFTFLKWDSKRLKISDPILLPLLIIFLLALFQSTRNIILDGVTVVEIIRELKRLYLFFYILPLIMLIKNKSQLRSFITILLIVGFVSSLVSIFQFFTGTTLYCSKVIPFAAGFYRVYHPNATFIGICLLVSISFSLFDMRIKGSYWVFFMPFYIIGVIVSFHRSLIISCFVGLLIIFVINASVEKNIKLFIKLFFVGLISVSTLFYFFDKAGLGLDPLISRINTSFSDVKRGEGTVYTRYLKVMFQASAINDRTEVFIGKGFLYNPEFMDVDFDPLALSSDIMYGNIYIFLGASGLLVLMLFYYNIFRTSYTLYKYSDDIYAKKIYLAFIPVSVIYFLIGFFSCVVFYPPILLCLLTFAGILCLLKYFDKSAKFLSENNRGRPMYNSTGKIASHYKNE